MLNTIKSVSDLKKIPVKDLPLLCNSIREKIISTMSKTGGHLASNLGAVELSVALHYVFNCPDDKIVFDVGHQCYTHKLITGRAEGFEKIRTKDGPSGFPRRKESVYDPVDAGHSSTSISSAIGFCVANDLKNKDSKVIVVIGDGALTGGEAFEGMNFTGHLDLPLIVILNDNDMSIGKNVGAVSNFLNKIAVSNFYQRIIEFWDKRLEKSSGVIRIFLRFLYRFKRGLKYLVGYENLFTNLGFEYIGPINGHDIDELIYFFNRAKNNIKHPVLLHVKTVKGKGYPMAEGDPSAFHGVTPDKMNSTVNVAKTMKFHDYFSRIIVDLGRKHANIVAITAAMESGTGLSNFKNNFPERFFDVGIAEQHAVTFSAALAFEGFKPILALYSTFLLRALDQVTQDVCISKAPVIFAIDRAGIVGADGETHQGQFDISFLRMIPNMTILAPCDAMELQLMLEYAYSADFPVAVRYPKAIADASQLNNNHPALKEAPYVNVVDGKDVLIIVVGPFVTIAGDAIHELGKNQIDAGLIYLRSLKPLPKKLLLSEMKKYQSVLVIEENVKSGSVSEEIAGMIAMHYNDIRVSSINIPDRFIEHDTRDNILEDLGFSQAGIINAVYKLVDNSSTTIPK